MLTTATRLRLLLAAAATIITAATPGQAALFTHVYTGTVTYGYDYADIFKAGPDLAGLTYTATYLIDDAKGTISEYSNDDGIGSSYSSSSTIYGGTRYGIPDNPVSAKFTINGNTVAIGGSYDSNVNESNYNPIYNGSGAETAHAFVQDYNYDIDGNYVSNYLYLAANRPNDVDYRPANFRIPQNFGPSYGFSYFGINDSVTGLQAYAALDVASFTSSAAAVPEPASWAMMIGGFGIVGGALRRRPRRIALMA